MNPIAVLIIIIILTAYIFLPRETLRNRAKDIVRENTSPRNIREEFETVRKTTEEITENIRDTVRESIQQTENNQETAESSAEKLESTSPEKSAEPTTN